MLVKKDIDLDSVAVCRLEVCNIGDYLIINVLCNLTKYAVHGN